MSQHEHNTHQPPTEDASPPAPGQERAEQVGTEPPASPSHTGRSPVGHQGHGGGDARAGHGGHGDHAAQFRDKFWLTLALTAPVVAFSEMFADLLGYPVPDFTGASWVSPVLGTIVSIAVWVWTIVTAVIAIRQALDYKSTGRAVIVCIITGVIGVVLSALFGALLFMLAEGMTL